MLKSSFDMKDLGQANVILGIQIKRNSEGYVLTQSHYAEKKNYECLVNLTANRLQLLLMMDASKIKIKAMSYLNLNILK